MPDATTRLPIALFVALLSAVPARAADPEPAPPEQPAPAEQAAPAAPREVKETTVVLGDFPSDLVGRWLAVGDVKLGDSGRVRPVAREWEIRKGPEHLEVTLVRSNIPDAIDQKVNAAAATGTSWQPTPEDLRVVADEWGKQPPLDGDYAAIENKLAVADAYPEEFKQDEITKGSEVTIAILENFTGVGAAKRAYTVYGVRERTPDMLKGTFLTSTFAMAPFPIPIVLKGDFRAYRVGSAPPAATSWWQRLFSGCQR